MKTVNTIWIGSLPNEPKISQFQDSLSHHSLFLAFYITTYLLHTIKELIFYFHINYYNMISDVINWIESIHKHFIYVWYHSKISCTWASLWPLKLTGWHRNITDIWFITLVMRFYQAYEWLCLCLSLMFLCLYKHSTCV